MYSQNQEEQFITNYFGDFKGNLLDIGANDGKTFSNSLRLIELGWGAFLVEPSDAYFKLQQLHSDNKHVRCFKCAIGETNGMLKFHESGHHLPDKSDYALLSTLNAEEKKRWKGTVEFKEVEVLCYTYADFLKEIEFHHFYVQKFHFINIDAEGLDIAILKQIDLTDTKLLCIEWNTKEDAKKEILEYCAQYGMTNIIYQNAENLLIAR